MNIQKNPKEWIAVLLFILSLFSIQFLDKPLALWIHANGWDQQLILTYITEYSVPALSIFCILFVLAYPIRLSLWHRFLFIGYVFLIVSLVIWIRGKLGIICGRSWPMTWPESGVYGSLISNDQYGFHFFQSHHWRGSFPSGHCVVISTICFTMYLYSPVELLCQRFLSLWMLPIILMLISQVLLNYHYLGDSLAGVALGIFASYEGFKIYRHCSSWLNRYLAS